MEQQEIEKRMVKMADALGVTVNENLPKIARAKTRLPDWRICPCDAKNPNRYCGSRQCESDIKRDGICHCHCYTGENKGESG